MKEHLNILMITHHRRYRTAGRSQVIARHLVERGHQVTLMVTSNERRFGVVESEWNGVRMVEAPDLLWGKLRSGWDLWSLINRLVFLKKEKPEYDLIHCFETRPGTIYPALYYARKHNLPLFSDWNDWFGRGGIIDVLRPTWYRIFFGWIETYFEEAFRPICDGTTVISTALGERAERLGICPDRICYLSGGTIPEEQVNHTVQECRAHLGLPQDIPVLGFASADSHLDMELVFSSLAIVAKRYPTVRLIITGRTHPELLKIADKFGVRENILLTGYVPAADLPWWMGCANIFLLPFPETISNVGRWPNKVGIYMSLERPIVTNPVGDIKTLVNQHRVGLAAKAEPADFSDKIIKLLEQPVLAHQLGSNGRKAALTVYNWKSLICTLEDFYLRSLQMKKILQTER